MNIPSPLVPQGTQPQRGKSSLYFKVLMIVTVHVVLIGGMLLQGCKDTAKETAKDPGLTQAGTDTTSLTNTAATAPIDTTVPALSTSSISNSAMAATPAMPSVQLPTSQPNPSAPITSAPMAATPASVPPVPPVPAVAVSGDYVIAKGDTLAAIAKRNSVSLHALMEANPGINAKKLRIGQKLQIPASTGAVASSASSSKAPSSEASASPATEGASEGSTYVVKSGDTLGKIARAHGTSYKKIMALNDLKTTGIRVGQKLKMPAPKPAGAEPIPASAALTPAPGPVSAVSTPSNGSAN